jgi:group II intron reverse transcriptase/maturase
MLQEVMRMLLEAYYEPQFSEHSHGFRPGLGCHTALATIQRTWKGTKWFIEGDIKGYFDSIDHTILINILRENIQDNRFIRLVEGMLKAGYCEQWTYRESLSGTPQGGIISPILANIYLDKMDKWVEETLIPKYNSGEKRKKNPKYRHYQWLREKALKMGHYQEAKEVEKFLYSTPYGDPDDAEFRRLRYVRYVDDFLIGFTGSRTEADEINLAIRDFLKAKLHLELSEDKTLITHAVETPARFVGYEIIAQHADTKRDANNTRSVNGVMALKVPMERLNELCSRYMEGNQPAARPEMLNNSDFDIVNNYGQVYRGYVEWFSIAQNVRVLTKLHWVMQTSLFHTLASKHRMTISQVAKKYITTVQTEDGPRKCVEVQVARGDKPPLVTRFGGIQLKRKQETAIRDHLGFYVRSRTELLKRLLAEECEICGCTDEIEVHHIRKMADLKRKDGRVNPGWREIMSAIRRKTLVVCRSCHADIHAGRPQKQKMVTTDKVAGELDDIERVTSSSEGD